MNLSIKFKSETTHTEESIHALAKMQYDIFSVPQKIITYLLSIILIVAGLYLSSKWYGIMYLFIGCLLITSTYVTANYTANKICKLINESGKGYPSSRFLFNDDEVSIYSLPDNTFIDNISYKSFIRISEDKTAFYLFPHKNGGYVIFKNNIYDNNGNKSLDDDFRLFIESRVGSKIKRINEAPIVKLLNLINMHNKMNHKKPL